MEAFTWNDSFATGLDRVDAQHHHLVDLVNQAGDLLLEHREDEAALQAFFGELAQYATEHFSEEETLMATWQVDARHVEAHTRHHREFVEQLVNMWERRQQSRDPAALLHGFLASWLTVHILGEDQRMAHMIQAIRDGSTPAAAYQAEASRQDRSVRALLDALYKLYNLLARQNQELLESNQRLEAKVIERTHNLAESNERLEKEQADLKQALAQIETTHQQLINAEKMASLGRLVAGFAHEMNTPLGIAVGAVSNADLVLHDIEHLLGGEEVDAAQLFAQLNNLREGNQLAISNLQRASEMVQRIKRSSLEQDTLVRQTFSLRNLMEDVLLQLKPRIEAVHARVQVDCPATLLIDGLPGLYEQIFISIIGNALRHAFNQCIDTPEITLRAAVNPPGTLIISCQDNGVGMTTEVAEHIFEPFFTTQRATGRPGLGLYMCYNIVSTKLGGEIHCRTAPGQGSTFELSLPIDRSETSQ